MAGMYLAPNLVLEVHFAGANGYLPPNGCLPHNDWLIANSKTSPSFPATVGTFLQEKTPSTMWQRETYTYGLTVCDIWTNCRYPKVPTYVCTWVRKAHIHTQVHNPHHQLDHVCGPYNLLLGYSSILHFKASSARIIHFHDHRTLEGGKTWKSGPGTRGLGNWQSVPQGEHHNVSPGLERNQKPPFLKSKCGS